jgi:Putative Ig domain
MKKITESIFAISAFRSADTFFGPNVRRIGSVCSQAPIVTPRKLSAIALCIVLMSILSSQAFAETEPLAITPNTYDFKDHDIGTTDKTIFKIQNQGTSKLTVMRVWIAGSANDYFIDQNDCDKTLDSREFCSVTVGFSPVDDRTIDEKSRPSLQLEYSIGDHKSYVSSKLLGSGHFPDLSVSPSQIQFAPQRISTLSAAQIITITNPQKGGSTRTISTVSGTGDFLIQSQSCAQPLKVGDSCTVVVNFSPKWSGLAQGMLRVTSDSQRSPHEITLTGHGIDCWDGTHCVSRSHELLAVILFAGLYWLGMLLVRWNRVAKSTRRLLAAQIGSSIVQLAYLVQLGNAVGQIGDLFSAARNLFEKQKFYERIADFLFWSRGQEITGWGYVHEAEIQMAKFLPTETVRARLETAQRDLKTLNTTSAESQANDIQQALSGTPPASLDRCQALLAEALNTNYNKSDGDFADLVSWQNKTGWLVACGLLLIVGLSATLDHAVLFLVGGTGGLLSRLSRSLQRKDVPTDYGASWTTLFLSPVVGALGGWTGILLATVAVKVGVLGSVFSVDWNDTYGAITLGLALLFGVSERAFDSVLSKLDDKVAGPASTNQSGQKAGLKITTDANLPSGTVGQDYRAELKATGGAGSLTWTKTGGSLPDGLTMDSNGVVSNRPLASATAKTFTFTAEVNDGSSKQSQQFTINVN